MEKENRPIAACSGKDAKSRHPKVYLNTNKSGKVVCPYCYTVWVNTNFTESA